VSCVKSQLILIGDPSEVENERGCMDFRLTYEGNLPSSGNDSHGKEKHQIRKQFHPQLKKLWEESKSLKDLKHIVYPLEPGSLKTPPPRRIDYLANQFKRNNHRFVPLVTADLWLWCGLDVLYLRNEKPGKVLQASDIDGHLKTLFDALKMPQNENELGGHLVPDLDEDPFFCLLENDSLVSHLSIETDMMLERLIGGLPHRNDARLVIKVTLKPDPFGWGNMAFA